MLNDFPLSRAPVLRIFHDPAGPLRTGIAR